MGYTMHDALEDMKADAEYYFDIERAKLRTKKMCREWLLEQKELPIKGASSPPRSTFDAEYNKRFASEIELALKELDTLEDDDPEILEAMNELYERSEIDEVYEHYEDIVRYAPEMGTSKIIYRIENFRRDADIAYALWAGDLATFKLGVDSRYRNARAVQTEERQKEWNQYVPWLNEYFKRNPKYSLTDGRKACARHFGLSPQNGYKTVERHTKGYAKPK